MCVCVCVCVCVCLCVLMCWVDATMHRFIDALVDSPIQRMSRFILRFISVSNASDVVVLLSSASIFQFCCAVVLLISGLILVSFCWFWGQFSRHFCVRGRLLATLRPPGLPREGQRRKCEQKGGSWVHPWTPQEHPKSIKINRNLKVRQCVGVGMRFLCPRCRQVGAGYAQTTVNTMVWEAFHVFWTFIVFVCFWDRFGCNFG